MTPSSETQTLHEAARFAAIPAAMHDPSAPGRPPAVPPVPADRVAVAFAGDGAGAAEFTWGQRALWAAMVQYGWMGMGTVLPQPPDRTMQDVADELQYMMSRFPSLRTQLRFDADGNPSQELSADGEFTFEVYDADGDTDPQETAAVVLDHYSNMTRDYVNEWPLRIAVVRRDGKPTHIVSVACHMVADGAGMVVLSNEIKARPAEPPRGMELLDLARWQGSPAGQRQSAASLRHIETALRSVLPRPLPPSADRREPRYWIGMMTSAALGPAVQAIAERKRAHASVVLMTLYAIALGRRNLLNPAVLRPVVNNRFRPGLRYAVSNVGGMGICVLDVAETTVDEAVARARRSVRSAFKYAYYDPRTEVALIKRLTLEQPDAPTWGPDSWSLFNDRRTGKLASLDSASSDEGAVADELRDLLTRTDFRWVSLRDIVLDPVFVNIDDSPQGVVITILADTWYVAPADAEGLVRDMEEIAVAAATDPAVPTGVVARGGS